MYDEIEFFSYNFKGEDRENIADLLFKISAVQQELEMVSRGKAEFSAQNVELPNFDEDAIKALFGEQNPNIVESPAKKTVEKLCDFNKLFEEKINGVIGAAVLLLNEYNEFEEYIKSINSWISS